MISVNENSRNFIKKSLERISGNIVPSHLEVSTEKLTGNMKGLIPRDSVGIVVNELLVVEYYSRKV